MSATIYGIRRTGSIELRWIGQTVRSPEARLRDHIAYSLHMPLPTSYANWFRKYQTEVEAIVLADNVPDADVLRREREAIALFAAAGHRLFNVHGVPLPFRQPKYDAVAAECPTPTEQPARAA